MKRLQPRRRVSMRLSRNECMGISERASFLAERSPNQHWKRAYAALALAADHCDAMMARAGAGISLASGHTVGGKRMTRRNTGMLGRGPRQAPNSRRGVGLRTRRVTRIVTSGRA